MMWILWLFIWWNVAALLLLCPVVVIAVSTQLPFAVLLRLWHFSIESVWFEVPALGTFSAMTENFSKTYSLIWNAFGNENKKVLWTFHVEVRLEMKVSEQYCWFVVISTVLNIIFVRSNKVNFLFFCC